MNPLRLRQPTGCAGIVDADGRLRCMLIELRETEIDAFIWMGLLEAEMRNDRIAVSQALYAHLETTLGSKP
jgi:hypothetical protein